MARFFRYQTTQGTPRTVNRTEEEIRDLLRSLPRYRITLHRDGTHTTEYMERALCACVPILPTARARQVACETTHAGCAEVIVCPREPAEHYYLSLREWRLACSLQLV